MKCVIGLLLCFILTLPVFGLEYQVFEENGKMGIKNESGEIVIPASFEALGWSDGSFSIIGQVTGYRSKNKWGLLNLKKEFLTRADFEQLLYTGGDRIIVSKKINPFTLKLGCINLDGKQAIPFNYDGIRINGLRAIVFNKNGSKYEYGLIDLSDKGILPMKYKNIESLGTLRYAVQNFDNKIALFTDSGTRLTDFSIDSLSAFHRGWAIIHQDFNQGLLSREGEIKAEPKYREVKINDDGSVSVRTFDSWKTVSINEREKDLIDVDAIFPDGDNYRIIKSGKTGLLDKDFKIKIAPRYDYLGNFILGKAVAKKDGKYGVIRMDNSVIMPFLFDSLVVDGRLIRVKDKTASTISWSLFDTVGVRKSQNYYDLIGQYNGRFFPVMSRGYSGGMNAYGKEIIHCVYDSIVQAKEDRVAVKFKGQYGIISLEENWLLIPQPYPVCLVNNDLYIEKQPSLNFLKTIGGETVYFTTNQLRPDSDVLIERLPDGAEQKIDLQGRIINGANLSVEVEKVFSESEGMRGIKRDGKYGFVDSRGRLRVANRYEGIGQFKEGLAPVQILRKWGYVNASDKIVINPSYEEALDFNNGVAVVRRNGKAGILDRTGNIVLSLRYDQIQRLNNKFILTLNGLKGLADEKGNVMIDPRFDLLEIADNDQVVVNHGGKWGVLSFSGMNVIPMLYDQLIFVKEKGFYLGLKKSEWQALKL
jgi:hypothetical protein